MFHPKGPTFLELAVQALSSTERGYDLLAPKFDYTPFRTPTVILDAVRQHLTPLAPFGLSLDLCCGTGAGMELLRPLCRERVVGLDFSQGMLEVARRQVANTPGTADVEFVRGDALALPFGQVFDIAVCFGACGHILPKDEDPFIAEVWRVLRPGGRYVFVSSYPPPFFSIRHVVARLFNGAMHVRNALKSPPFIMYYLTFLLPEVQTLLQRRGFHTDIRPLSAARSLAPFQLVIAERP